MPNSHSFSSLEWSRDRIPTCHFIYFTTVDHREEGKMLENIAIRIVGTEIKCEFIPLHTTQFKIET